MDFSMNPRHANEAPASFEGGLGWEKNFSKKLHTLEAKMAPGVKA